MEQIIAAIAKEHLSFDTLGTRRSDSLDFREVAVWSVKAALEAAYKAGFEAPFSRLIAPQAKKATFVLSSVEAAYVIAALRIMYETEDLVERDEIVVTGLIDKLAAPLKLDPDILARLEQPRRPK
jgi:hypothetical protein